MRLPLLRSCATVFVAGMLLTLVVACASSASESAGARSAEVSSSTSTQRTSSTTTSTTTDTVTSTTTTTTTPPTTTGLKPVTTTSVKSDGPVYCTGVRSADSRWELAEASIGWVSDGSGLIFGGNARGGNWDGIQWGYSFEVADLRYVIVLGRWDDGTLNSFVQGPGVPDDNLLNEAFVAEGNASAVVPASWLKKLPADVPWTVRLMIDGTEVGSCSATL